jgi:ABC-2 type transport system ATP-binding protein
MTVLLSVTNLIKSYGPRRAVDGVSFQVLSGRTVGLLGPNGAGKSTIVAMLCGLLRPDAGTILLGGEAVAVGASNVKRRIGVVPQDLALYEDLSAVENLRLFGALYGLKGWWCWRVRRRRRSSRSGCCAPCSRPRCWPSA